MAAQKRQTAPQKTNQPVENKSSFIADFLFFPWKIQRAYANQAKKIRKIIKISEAHKKTNIAEDCKYRLRRQNYLSLLYIVFPIWIGLGVSSFFVYQERAHIVSYVDGIKQIFPKVPKTRPEVRVFLSKNGGLSGIKNRVKNLGRPPIKFRHFFPLILGYLGSFFGALAISMNRAFSIQDKLQLMFLKRKHLGSDDKPWGVCWTPSAILIETWNIDVDTLVDKKEIWGEAGIQPDCTLKDPKKPGTVVLAESQDLPKEVKIMFNEPDVAAVAKDSPKALEASIAIYQQEIDAQKRELEPVSTSLPEKKSTLNEVVDRMIAEEEEEEVKKNAKPDITPDDDIGNLEDQDDDDLIDEIVTDEPDDEPEGD